jgi:MoxR-like ATPase
MPAHLCLVRESADNLIRMQAPLQTPRPAAADKLPLFWQHANSVIVDKEREVRLTLCCLLAGGHLLIEDVPGVGKTTLVKMLARLMGLQTSRIQFTNDLLPADIIGSSIFNTQQSQFIFHPGPIFAQLVLGDELNRATPKSQSACLQAMEEHHVTVDGVTHALPQPFFFIGTQNPRGQIGTFPLPESQLDRFLMRVELGYPSRAGERELLLGVSREAMLENLPSIFNASELQELQAHVRGVKTSSALIDYIQNLVFQSRQSSSSQGGSGLGLSPRGSLNLLHAAQAWAFLQNRDHVLPEDVQAVAVAVMSHRLNPIDDPTGETGRRLAEDILLNVRVD